MDAAEERRCVRAWKRNGDTEARNRLVTAHLKIAQYWAYRYRATGAFEDLVNEGVLGLMKAADRFKPSKGCRFSTYAGMWVQSFVGRYAYETSQPVKPSGANAARRVWSKNPTSKAVPIDYVDAEGQSLIGRLDGGIEPPDEHAARGEANAVLIDALHTLDDRDQLIIAARYSADATLDALGRHLGLSRERVRQLEADALKRLGEAVRVMSGEVVPRKPRARRRWVKMGDGPEGK